MKKKLLIIILLTGALVLPSIALAQGDPIGNFAKNILSALVIVGGAAVTIGWIIAGVLYLTSAGSPEKMGTAKKAIVAAVIGTILVIISAGADTFIKQYWK